MVLVYAGGSCVTGGVAASWIAVLKATVAGGEVFTASELRMYQPCWGANVSVGGGRLLDGESLSGS